MLWILQQARFTDGTPASGFIDTDIVPGGYTLSDWDITTAAFHYTPDTSVGGFGPPRPDHGPGHSLFSFFAYHSPQAAQVELLQQLTIFSDEDAAVLATKPGVASLSGVSAEYFDCQALDCGRRNLMSGCLVSPGIKADCPPVDLFIPEPSAALIMLAVLGALALLRIRSKPAIQPA